MTYEQITNNAEILAYYKKGNELLGALGYTDHSMAHTALVAARAAQLLEKLGYGDREIELVKIAGFMHDIGNVINRSRHAEYGALLANEILEDTDLSLEDRVQIVSAIANHDESTGIVADPVTAALVLADKSDVRRNRVRESDPTQFDIHDRVNYAVQDSQLCCDPQTKTVTLELRIDEEICTMFDYFEIFLERMMMCSNAARVLGTTFSLVVNGNKVL